MYSESRRRAIWGSAINRPSLIVRPSTKMRALSLSHSIYVATAAGLSVINRPSLIVRPSTKMRAVAASAVTVKPVSAYGPVCVYKVYYTIRLRLRRHRFRV